MSFTIMRYTKDGQPNPIKMSIWDAFKGVPTAKLKKRPAKVCSCCKKTHSKNGIVDESIIEESKKGVQQQVPVQGNTTKTNTLMPQEETYSNEENGIIIRMKGEHKSWKQILAAIEKKNEGRLKQHWKTINPATHIGAASSRDESTGEKQHEAGKENNKDNEDEGLKTPSVENKSQLRTETKANEHNTNQVEDGKDRTQVDSGNGKLRAFAYRYDEQKWIAAASRHYDLTGQRITPEQAKQLIKEK